MQLLPKGTRRRQWFEAVDRWLGHALFGEPKTISTHCGDRIKNETAGVGCKCLCRALDLVEKEHCIKNAGKP